MMSARRSSASSTLHLSGIHASRLPLVLAALLLCAAGGETRAQWSAYANVNTPVAVGMEEQLRPRAASDGAGGAIIVWDLGAVSDIASQRLSAGGYPQWTLNGVPLVRAAGLQRLRGVASDGARGAIVVWDDYNGAAGYDILACRVDSAGRQSWGSDPVAVCTAAWDQYNAELAMTDQHTAVIAWQDARHNGYTVYAQKLGMDGSPQWQNDGILVCNVQESQLLPRITGDGFGGALVAWEDGRNTGGSGGDIYAQRINADGQLLWKSGGVPVCSASGTQKSPRLTADGSGGTVIVWQDQRSGSANADIYAQHLDAAGQPQWLANGIVVCGAPNMQYDPCMVRDSSGGVIVCWTDQRTAYSERVVVQRIAMNSGSALWTVNGVDVSPVGQNMRSPAIMADTGGGAFVVWQDGRAGADNLNIYAQRLDGWGNRLWGLTALAICNASGKQTVPQLCPGEGGGAIITWEDGRDSTRPDIYASFVSAGGLIPVELLSFEASVSAGVATLRWTTAAETNNAGFELRRSRDGTAWEPRAFIPGTGTGPGRNYRHDDILGDAGYSADILWYQLLQRDLDGSTHPSPVITVRRDGRSPATPVLRVSPQPATAIAQIIVTLERDAVLDLHLVDALGRRVATVAASAARGSGAHAFVLSLSAIPPGYYTVVLRSADGVASVPLIRTR